VPRRDQDWLEARHDGHGEHEYAQGRAPREAPRLDGSARDVPPDDPGFWGFDPAPNELSVLQAQVEVEEPHGST
jgi:hypothetical protein